MIIIFDGIDEKKLDVKNVELIYHVDKNYAPNIDRSTFDIHTDSLMLLAIPNLI